MTAPPCSATTASAKGPLAEPHGQGGADRGADREARTGVPAAVPPDGPRRIRCVHFLGAVRFELGGVIRSVLDLCTVLAARGHEVTLLAGDGSDIPPAWPRAAAGERVPAGARLPAAVAVGGTGAAGLLNRSSLARAAKVLDTAGVLHLHGPWEPANLQLARLARRRGVPYVVTVHGMLDDWSMSQKPWKKRLFHALVGGRYLRGAARIHCTAGAELEQARQWFGRRSGAAAVIPYIVDLSPYRSLPGPDVARAAYPEAAAPEPKVLFLSRVHPKKGVEVLIRAAALLRDQGSPVRLLVAGPGEPRYLDRLRGMARDLGLEGSVTLLGLVTGVEKTSLYQAADVFVLPTSQENFGLVLVESLACGTPVITTRGTDIWQEMRDAGARVVAAEAGPMAAAIREVLSDRPSSRATGEQGRRWVFNHLDPDRIIGRYEAMYAEAMTAGAGPR